MNANIEPLITQGWRVLHLAKYLYIFIGYLYVFWSIHLTGALHVINLQITIHNRSHAIEIIENFQKFDQQAWVFKKALKSFLTNYISIIFRRAFSRIGYLLRLKNDNRNHGIQIFLESFVSTDQSKVHKLANYRHFSTRKFLLNIESIKRLSNCLSYMKTM